MTASNANGGWEYPLCLIIISGVVALQAEPTMLGSAAPGIERNTKLA